MRHLAYLVMIAACSGGVGGGGEGDVCASTSDCDDGLDCAGVNDGPVCGIAPRQECNTDNDCLGGTVCHAIFDSCSADGVGSTCGEPCVDQSDCQEGFTCDVGRCIAIPCDDGFACAGRESCDPSRIASTAPVFDRHHGCFAVACSSDDECGDRFCVNGSCQDDTGSCTEPVAVP